MITFLPIFPRSSRNHPANVQDVIFVSDQTFLFLLGWTLLPSRYSCQEPAGNVKNQQESSSKCSGCHICFWSNFSIFIGMDIITFSPILSRTSRSHPANIQDVMSVSGQSVGMDMITFSPTFPRSSKKRPAKVQGIISDQTFLYFVRMELWPSRHCITKSRGIVQQLPIAHILFRSKASISPPF